MQKKKKRNDDNVCQQLYHTTLTVDLPFARLLFIRQMIKQIDVVQHTKANSSNHIYIGMYMCIWRNRKNEQNLSGKRRRKRKRSSCSRACVRILPANREDEVCSYTFCGQRRWFLGLFAVPMMALMYSLALIRRWAMELLFRLEFNDVSLTVSLLSEENDPYEWWNGGGVG